MYKLFSRSKAYLVLGCALTFLFLGTLVHDRAHPYTIIAVAVCGVFASWLCAEFSAAMRHHAILLVLYRLLRPGDFIRLYEPLLANTSLRCRIRFTMLMYLSKGYSACGEFERAEQLLDQAAALPCTKREDVLALVASHKSRTFLARGDASSAHTQLEILAHKISIVLSGRKRRSLEETHKSLTACLAIAERRCSHNDALLLERRLKRNGSPLLTAELRLWLARAYLSLESKDLAMPLLRQVSSAGKELYISEQARDIMKTEMEPVPDK